jgi:DNA invertase Pin-like site-specific DNA recombinase
MNIKKAVIYCRVSSQKQVDEGHGLESQEKSCKSYANSKGYVVDKVFHEGAVSGGDFDRPEMNKLLEYLTINNNEFVVIFDDISRLARDVSVHKFLVHSIKGTGATIDCIGLVVGSDTPSDIFVETVMAAAKENERLVNRLQVIKRQMSRLEMGYWVFCHPPGYTYKEHDKHGKLLYKDEPNASIIKEALEGFANNRFVTQEDVRVFLESKKYKATGKSTKPHAETVKRMLTKSLYAGIVEYKKWEVKAVDGHHEPLIAKETYFKIQDKLSGKARCYKSNKGVDFPLRGFVQCAECNEYMTASWSTGRSKKHPYYRCKNKNCSCGNKSIKRESIEGDFSELLKNAVLQNPLISLLKVITKEIYSEKIKESRLEKKAVKKEMSEIDKDISNLVDRLSSASNDNVANAIERSISEKEEYKNTLRDKYSLMNKSGINFETAVNGVLNFIGNPYDAWNKGDLLQKSRIQKLVFVRPLKYSKSKGFGTAEMSLPFSISGISNVSKSSVVEMADIQQLL